jgi:hypothetical protein
VEVKIGHSEQELIQTARDRLPRELNDAEKQHFHMTTE